MEMNKYKLVTVFSLVIAVVALAVGFASYTATLTIENSSATIPASDQFSPYVQYKQGTLSCVKTGTSTAVTSTGSLNDASHATVWTGASVSMSGIGDSVTCSATVENLSTFTAYLKSITIASPLSCAPVQANATLQNLTGACNAVGITVTQGTASATASGASKTDATISDGSVTIAPSGEATVSFTIEYPNGSPVTDGDFVVTIPTITFRYETVS